MRRQGVKRGRSDCPNIVVERRWRVTVKPTQCVNSVSVIVEQVYNGVHRQFACREAQTCSFQGGALRLTLPQNITFECCALAESGELINPAAHRSAPFSTVAATVQELTS